MKKLTITIGLLMPLLMCGVVSKVSAQSTCKQQPIETLAKAIAENYPQKTLTSLDQQKAVRGTFRVVIEHSLAEDDAPNRFVVHRFVSLSRFERWLKRREVAGMPSRSVMPFQKCARGVCTFDFDGGILHNNLYLKKISYGILRGCPYLKTIYLLDGD